MGYFFVTVSGVSILIGCTLVLVRLTDKKCSRKYRTNYNFVKLIKNHYRLLLGKCRTKFADILKYSSIGSDHVIT